MDKWSRNDQNTYTGISAQRRNRHRTGSEPEKAARSPEIPEALKAVTERTSLNTEAFMRPRVPAQPDESMDNVVPEEPAGSGLPEGNAAAEETEAAAEPVSPERTGAAESAELPEEAEEEAEENAGAPEEPAAAETPAEPEMVVQGADSRVPAEARRMAASPYGTAGTDAVRPGTGARTAKRAPRPDEKRVNVSARPQREDYGPDNGETASIRTVRPPRVHVGYAPGRMADGMTQQVPVQDMAHGQLYTKEAKEYLDRQKHPFRPGKKKDAPDRPGHKVLRAAVVLLLIAGAVITGVLATRNRNQGMDIIRRDAPQVISFSPPETDGLTAPVDLPFSATTAKDVSGIRLRGEDGRELATENTCGDNTDGKLWTMKMHVDTGFDGKVILQVRRGEVEEWYDTEFKADVKVKTPLGVTPVPEDYYGSDAGNTDIGSADDGTEAGEPGDVSLVTGAESAETGDDSGNTGEDTAETGEDSGDPDGGLEKDDGEIPTGELRAPEPTATPAPVTPEPTATPPLTAEAAAEASPDMITNITVWTGNTKKEKAYSRPAKELIHMPAADEYTTKRLGVMTFRGDNFRRNAAAGTIDSDPEGLSVVWKVQAGSVRGTSQTYWGYGWTGQPAIARWSSEIRAASNLYEKKRDKEALKEVIIAGLDGVVRFLDLQDGSLTRNGIKLGYPMRGTPTLHTKGYPFMTVGQAVRKLKSKAGQIGLREYNLYSQKAVKLVDGLDGKYHRPLNDIGSFNTSALIDRTSDTLIVAGTNGALYLESLGTNFDYKAGVLSVSPSFAIMTNKIKGQKNKALLAVESSLAAYDKYVFYADMGGILRCVDTNSLTPVWAVATGDSVMAAVALDLTESRDLNLYTANMLNNRKKGNSQIQIRRYDALSGKEAWTTEIGVTKGKKDKDDVGAKASPVIGQNRLEDLVYFTVTGLSDEGRSKLSLQGSAKAALIALDKNTGRMEWAYGLASRSESSPIAVYDEEGNGWIIQCEQNGSIHLLEGLNGRVVDSLKLDAEIEASPAAYGSTMVVGSTGKNKSYVFGISIGKKQAEQESEAP